MRSFSSLRGEWLADSRANILSGIVVALALIPEAIGFSIIAGVDPKVGLYASFSIAVITALVGGRPGMISAATAEGSRATPPWESRSSAGSPGTRRMAAKTMLATSQISTREVAMRFSSQGNGAA